MNKKELRILILQEYCKIWLQFIIILNYIFKVFLPWLNTTKYEDILYKVTF